MLRDDYKLYLVLLQVFIRMQLTPFVHLTKKHVHSECKFAKVIFWNNRVKKLFPILLTLVPKGELTYTAPN